MLHLILFLFYHYMFTTQFRLFSKLTNFMILKALLNIYLFQFLFDDFQEFKLLIFCFFHQSYFLILPFNNTHIGWYHSFENISTLVPDVRGLDVGHSSRYVVECYFNLLFADDIRFGSSSHMIICHLCISFGEVSMKVFVPFFNGMVAFLLLSLFF